jgi:hypothetical protein
VPIRQRLIDGAVVIRKPLAKIRPPISPARHPPKIIRGSEPETAHEQNVVKRTQNDQTIPP